MQEVCRRYDLSDMATFLEKGALSPKKSRTPNKAGNSMNRKKSKFRHLSIYDESSDDSDADDIPTGEAKRHSPETTSKTGTLKTALKTDKKRRSLSRSGPGIVRVEVDGSVRPVTTTSGIGEEDGEENVNAIPEELLFRDISEVIMHMLKLQKPSMTLIMSLLPNEISACAFNCIKRSPCSFMYDQKLP